MAAFALLLSTAASADTIYLKNGRVIHTSAAKQVGDKVEFIQFGQTASIPASVVLRIERDARDEEPPLPAAPTESGRGTESDTDPAVPPGQDAGAEGEGESVAPEASPEYWSGRVRDIEREKTSIAEQIDKLHLEERAFLSSPRSTAEVREQIEAAQERDKELDQELVDLRREARLLGVPPGWLRVRPGTTGS